jgi:DNA repair protein RadA/Sms
MALKTKEVYVCNQCAYESPKWGGQCPICKEWNTFEVQTITASKKTATTSVFETVTPINLNEVSANSEPRYYTGVSELDRVLGGGIVKGSLVLLGGDPGIGKSTLLLQICDYIGKEMSILYVSGEESVRQIKLRANRLNVSCDNLYMAASTNIETVIHTIEQNKPSLVMVDSIQTMSMPNINSSAGSVVQVRECTNALMRVAKSYDIPIFIVGHVNKDGAIAGPKVLEHIVDAVLYFEGDRNLSYRILRAVKNRFGSTNEIGMFEMQDVGLVEVTNPSKMLLSGRELNVSGTCVACVMEGTRPILSEVQGLVTKTGFGTPRRMATGFDYNRMSLLIAVLEKRVGYFFGNLDTYVNVVGGLKLDEPSADLPVALALVSSLRDKPIDEHILAFGEIGLAGEIRAVSNAETRVREAKRLGFKKCIIPKNSLATIKNIDKLGIEVIGVRDVKQALASLG